ncbi:MAG: NnrS family protein [Chthoniobacterales bacterium]|nr:NnrS family protein [Chthoniobacterales bacterium]
MKTTEGKHHFFRGLFGARSDGKPGYWQLVAAGEPFRMLFPLGAIIGIVGVAMWPLFVWHITAAHPGIAHARIMVEGFLACFVTGFLGTALPRLLGVPKITIYETVGFGVALVATVCLHHCGFTLWGDLLFFCTLLSFVLLLGVRIKHRQDTPPPAFILVAMGLLSALTGSLGLVISQAIPTLAPPWLLPVAKLLLYQGFILLPIMGIGAFLLPRFFGLPNRQSFPESLALPPGWKRRATFAATCGLVVIASFAMEALGIGRWAYALRAGALLVYFFREVPVHQAGFGGGSLAFGLRIALFAIPTGYILLAIMPERSTTLLHVVFITGFSLLTFIVASRVVFGHSGQTEKFRASLWPILVLCALFFLAMLTRVSADWLPKVQMNHYAYAAVAWATGVILWAICILPGVRKADAE